MNLTEISAKNNKSLRKQQWFSGLTKFVTRWFKQQIYAFNRRRYFKRIGQKPPTKEQIKRIMHP
jgi:hypothetical protein